MRAYVIPLLKHRFGQEVDEVGVDGGNRVMLEDRLCRLIQSRAAVKLKFFVNFTFFKCNIKIVVPGIR